MANQCGREPRWQRRLGFQPPELTARAENFRTSERGAALGESHPICSRWRFSIQTGRRPRAAKTLGDGAVSKQSAPLLLCRSRPHRVWGKQTSERTLRAGGNRHRVRRGHFGSIGIAFSPAYLPAQEKKSDVRHPVRRSRRSCRVAIAPFEGTNRSGWEICTMRHFGRVAMGNSPRELTWQADQEPIMANQMDHAPRRHCRLGYFPGGADLPYGEKTNYREASERSAALRDSPRIFKRYLPSQAERRPRATE